MTETTKSPEKRKPHTPNDSRKPPESSQRPETSPNNSRKLPLEEIEKSCTRLHSSHRKERILPDIIPKRTLSKDEESNSVKRLYEEAIRHQAVKMEQLEKKLETKWKKDEGKKLADAELSEAVSRLYDQSLLQKREGLKKLEKKYVSPQRVKRLGKEGIDTINGRLFSASCAKSSETKTKLFDKYVLQLYPKCKKSTQAQWETSDSFSRLVVKK